jgi:hypothetical protein
MQKIQIHDLFLACSPTVSKLLSNKIEKMAGHVVDLLKSVYAPGSVIDFIKWAHVYGF